MVTRTKGLNIDTSGFLEAARLQVQGAREVADGILGLGRGIGAGLSQIGANRRAQQARADANARASADDDLAAQREAWDEKMDIARLTGEIPEDAVPFVAGRLRAKPDT